MERSPGRVTRWLALAAMVAAGCTTAPRSPRSEGHVRWLVIAPHPDDEALMAGGVIAKAVAAHEAVAVAIVTNGDYDCVADGLTRQAESVRAMAELGLAEEHIHFLGYPDGFLPKLGTSPLPKVRRSIGGKCAEGATTYGTHGVKRERDLPYTRGNAIADLVNLLRELTPEEVVLPHPEDTHGDHAETYVLFRDALDLVGGGSVAAGGAGGRKAPRVHRALIHNGDCWPMSAKPDEPCPDLPVDYPHPTLALSGRMAGYDLGRSVERFPVSDQDRDAKTDAIAEYASQTKKSEKSYLFSFSRTDEVFFPESFERLGGRWVRRGDHVVTTVTKTIAEKPALAHPAVLAFEGWRLELGGQLEARLVRDGAADGGPPRRTWALPHDAWKSGPETVEVTVHPRPEDGPNISEVAVRMGGALIGVAVDLHHGGARASENAN